MVSAFLSKRGAESAESIPTSYSSYVALGERSWVLGWVSSVKCLNWVWRGWSAWTCPVWGLNVALVQRASPPMLDSTVNTFLSLSFNSRFSEELTKMVSLCIRTSHFLIGLLSVSPFFLIVTIQMFKCHSVYWVWHWYTQNIRKGFVVSFGKDILRAEVILVWKLAESPD